MVNDRGVMGGASNNDSLTSYCDAVFVYLSLCISSVYFAIVPTKYKCSVPNSSSGLIFVKIRAESGRIFSKDPGKIRAKIRAILNSVILSSSYDLGRLGTLQMQLQ